MPSAIDFAKYFLQRGLDTNRNTYDGNMKLQKLLFFADFISLVNRGIPLFNDSVLAFSNGCVIEDVRQRYKSDCFGLVAESESFIPSFSAEEKEILQTTIELFADTSAKELSELNHTFSFWKRRLETSTYASGYRSKELAVIPISEMLEEKDAMQSVLESHRVNKAAGQKYEMINGVRFFYDPGFSISDEMMEQLEAFSEFAEDEAYTIYSENGELVIF